MQYSQCAWCNPQQQEGQRAAHADREKEEKGSQHNRLPCGRGIDTLLTQTPSLPACLPGRAPPGPACSTDLQPLKPFTAPTPCHRRGLAPCGSLDWRCS